MPDVDLAVILADGDYLKRVGDELVGDPGSGNIVATYSVPRITYTGAAGTNANGDFAITTGFTPTAAHAICANGATGTPPGYPIFITLREFPDNVQAVFRAFWHDGSPVASTSIAVSVVVFGPPA